jgi:hypothetical protein
LLIAARARNPCSGLALARLNGAAIAKANRLSLDKLSFNEEGNRTVGFMAHGVGLEW